MAARGWFAGPLAGRAPFTWNSELGTVVVAANGNDQGAMPFEPRP